MAATMPFFHKDSSDTGRGGGEGGGREWLNARAGRGGGCLLVLEVSQKTSVITGITGTAPVWLAAVVGRL